jgi:hypothetical protein
MDKQRWIRGAGAVVAFLILGVVLLLLLRDPGRRAPPSETIDAPAVIISPPPEDRPRPPIVAVREPGQREPAFVPYADLPVMAMPGVPALELARDAAQAAQITITADFEGCAPLEATALSPTHFRLRFTRPGMNNYFLFRVQGAAGKTVRIDFETPTLAAKERKWTTLNPVYAYIDDLNAEEAYRSEAPPQPHRHTLGFNGTFLPDTRGQQWHFVSDVWTEGTNTCWVMRFERDSAYVAMRPPFMPAYGERYLAQVAANPYAAVAAVGRSQQGRALQLLRIGDDPEEAQKSRPCIVIYAREHPSETDSSWLAQGAAQWLLSAEPAAAELRRRVTFLIIPVLDPDGCATAMFSNMTDTFFVNRGLPESHAFANWFRQWVDAGGRLDLVLNLHNQESLESQHLMCYTIDPPPPAGRRDECLAVHNAIVRHFASTPYIVEPRPRLERIYATRLGSFLALSYGPLHLSYEANCQAPPRHLTLADLREIGRLLAEAAAMHVLSPEFASVQAGIDKLRQDRAEIQRAFQTQPVSDVFVDETRIRMARQQSAAPPPPPPAVGPAPRPGPPTP